MKFDKKMYGIYLTSAIIIAGLVYMGISTFYVMDNVMGQTSVDIAIDKKVDECWDKKQTLDN